MREKLHVKTTKEVAEMCMRRVIEFGMSPQTSKDERAPVTHSRVADFVSCSDGIETQDLVEELLKER